MTGKERSGKRGQCPTVSSKSLKPRDRFKIHHLPLYDVWVEVGLVENCKRAQETKRRQDTYGQEAVRAQGVAMYSGDRMCILLQRKNLSHNLIGHEVLHTVHNIAHRCGFKLKQGHTEPHAYLAGHLSQLVYGDVLGWLNKKKDLCHTTKL